MTHDEYSPEFQAEVDRFDAVPERGRRLVARAILRDYGAPSAAVEWAFDAADPDDLLTTIYGFRAEMKAMRDLLTSPA